MNHKEQFEQHVLWKIQSKENDIIVVERLVNRLIESLYKPHEKYQFVRDAERCEKFSVEEEPINWGDLKCNEVKRFDDGSYLVVIDEASPKDCQTFCEYIENFMKEWGWSVRVETEW